MSFKGLVTRKEQDTGVTLLAKVVTANKKKSQKKQYKVRVIANGMSDRECCNRDLTYVKNSFYEQGISDLCNSLNFVPVGPHGTNITYNIVNESADSPLTDFLDKNTGKLVGKPLFGHDDASGRIQITVTKGDETLTGVVNVVVKAYTAFEVLNNSDIINSSNLWVAIANGDNPYYLRGNKVNLVQEWSPWIGTKYNVSDTPISVSWVIEDKLHKAALIDKARATVGDTGIYNPSYEEISAIVRNGNASLAGVTVSEGTPTSYSEYDKVLKMDGLKLQATLTLGDETVVMEAFNVSTNSLALTNTEVISAVTANSTPLASGAKESTMFEIYDVSTGSDLGGYIVYGSAATLQSNTEQVTHIDASKLTGSTFAMRILSSQSLERASVPELLIEKGKLAGSVTNIAGAIGPVFAFNGSDDYALNPITTQSIFGWTGRDEASKDTILTVDLAQMKAYVESGETGAVGFSVKQTLTISKYSGAEKSTTIMRQFVIDNIAAVGGGTSDSGSEPGDTTEETVETGENTAE